VYSLVIGITYDPPISECGRALHKITKEVQKEAAYHWHRDILPGHFKEGAAQRYGYAPRVTRRKLLRRKRRKPPHPLEHLPLIHTGEAMKDILSPPHIGSYPTRVTITMPAPDYFTLNPKPDMVAEVGVMTFREQDRIMQRMGSNAMRMLKESGRKETVIITGG